MSRRRTIVLSSAAVLLAVIALLFAVGGVATRTEFGEERVRAFLSAWLGSKVRGTMYIGRVHGSFFDGVTVDSIEIRDDRGELFLASGPAMVVYDVRDVFDRRILVQNLVLRNPVVQIRKYPDGTWNYRRIFPGGQPEPIGRRRGFGDFVVVQSALISGAKFTLTLPWNPSTGVSKTGAVQLAEALADPSGHVRQTRHGPARVWRWENGYARLGYTRLAHPDTSGRLVTVRNLSVDTHDPPFNFRSVEGTVSQRGDSVAFAAPHWRLPQSSGRAHGTVTWGGGRPNKYAIRIEADRAGLADVAWIHPTFPRSGGGRVNVDIRNVANNRSDIEYAVTDLDVRTVASHIVGRMVVDPSGPILAVRDVAVRLDPVDVDLLRTLHGGPFTYDWQGAVTGTVRASGGPVHRFRVEEADLVYSDAHLRGATSSGSASGVIDVSDPSLAVFHGLRVEASRFDLRTPRRVIPKFPRVGGSLSGRATLDSLWLDVRFRDADVVHRDGDAPASRFTGAGRVTLADPYLTYDLAVVAQPVSFTALGRSYPDLPARGEFTGPIRIRGQAPRLLVSAALSGDAGGISFEGIVDADEPSYSAVGTGLLSRFDLARFARAARAPRTSLTGRYELDLKGASLPSLLGSFATALDSSRVGDVRLSTAYARGQFRDGVLTIDTARGLSPSGAAVASGTVALTDDRSGTLRFSVEADSLIRFSSLLRDARLGSWPDLSGRAVFRGEVRTGSTVALRGEIEGTRIGVGARRAERLTGNVDLTRVGGRYTGSFSAAADTVRIGRTRLSDAWIVASMSDDGTGTFTAELVSENGAHTAAGGALFRAQDLTRVRIDSIVARADSAHTYRTNHATTMTFGRGSITLDSLVLAPATGPGSIAARDLVWSRDSIRGAIRTRDADLSLLRGFLPSISSASGPLNVAVDLGGTPKRPRPRGSLQIRNGALTLADAGIRYDRVVADIVLDDTQLRIRELSAESPRAGGRRGTARITGNVDFVDYSNPVFLIEAAARGFRALDRPGVASLDVSTGPALQLTGPYNGAVLRGSLIVDEGTLYLPERLDKDIADLGDPSLLALVDTGLASQRRLLPSLPTALLTNLRLDDVNVVLGDNVWLRSSEANIELGGSLRVTRTRPATDDRSQLALVGALNAVRGTYVLNMTVVQPTFQVERGTLRFFGAPEVNPALDIRAIHTVRQPRRSVSRDDVRILAAITGTLRNPQLSLSSADSLPLSQSDLLSYLVTGEPAFALTGTSTEYAEQLLTLGGRLAATLISARIPRSVFDIVEVRTGAVRLSPGATGTSTSYLNTLYNTRVILGKQIGDRWYVGLSTGLCRENFAENLGLRLEYRFSSTYFAQGGIEPGSGDLTCVGPAIARTFQQTPPQLGFDLFRTWRF
jgi:hypothetical protein